MAQRRGSHSRLQSNPTANNTAHTHNYSKTRHHPSSHRGVLSLLRSLRNVKNPSSASTSPSSEESRQVLAPLQFNLRRLPSRLALPETVVMRVSGGSDHVKVGAKRKRVVSGNENTHSVSRGSRNGLNAFKRRRPSLQHEDSSDEGTGTAMEVDTSMRCSDSELSSDGDASDWDSCMFSLYPLNALLTHLYFIAVDYLINQAPTRELLRLKKGRLQELHRSAGLSDDPETLTKQEIIDVIISARDDLTELPPSSPYGGTNSSECSSDDGNIAGGEETDASHRRSHPLGSRQHVAQNVAHAPNLAAPQLGRSFSLGHTTLPAPTGVSCQIETRSVHSQSRELNDQTQSI
jgi:mitogen-activated protein kinase kinase kinase 13